MISFQNEGVTMPAIDVALVSKWLTGVATDHDRRIGDLNYQFCNDEEILRVNREFLNHDYYTDIITFDYSIGEKVGADIVISLDTVKSNSEEIGTDFTEELHRVIVHGLLHLCGIKDKTPEERAKMEAEENRALEMLKELRKI